LLVGLVEEAVEVLLVLLVFLLVAQVEMAVTHAEAVEVVEQAVII
jgi:hypothetical protein